MIFRGQADASTSISQPTRREAVSLLLGSAAALTVSVGLSSALAQDYPSRTMQIVVTYGPGGPNDVLGRLMAEKLKTRLGQPVIVDNRPGGGGSVGLRSMLRMPPDGHTLVVLSPGHAIEQAFRKDPQFDLRTDVLPVASLATIAQVFVAKPDFRFKTMAEVVSFLKANPGKLTCGTASPPQVEYFRSMAKVDLVIVPYRGASLSVQDVLGGQVDLAFPPLPDAFPHMEAKTLRAVGVTGSSRLAEFPDVVPIAESVPGFALDGWYGLGVAAGTPDAIVARLRQELAAIVATSEVQDFLRTRRFGPPVPFDKFPALLSKDVEQFQKLVRDHNLPMTE